MTALLQQLFKFFKLLNSDTGTNQLASGMAAGIILGFAPFFSLQTLVVLFLVLIFRVQLGAAFLSAFFFKFVAYLFDPAADVLGRWALEAEALRPIYTQMYQMPIIPYTRFNNSIVMGSFIVSLILVIPAFFIFRKMIAKYRQVVVARFKQTRFWKIFTATTFYKWYVKYDDLYNV